MIVGIDDIAVYIPKLYLDANDYAKLRKVSATKLQKGLGVYKMAIMDSNQDPACFAANACLKIMQKNKLSPDDIGRLYVSTESSFDESKAMNSYVIGMLEQVYGAETFEHCGGVETKFACVSGSYALYDNINWIRAGESDGKYSLVIVSDIAKYDMGSSGEMTQGAGAVVLLLKDNPRLLSFDPKVTATSIKDEYDFYRPFGKETPIVHGQYSNLLYLIQIKKAFEIYKKKVISSGLIKLNNDESILDHIDYLNMHLPYAKMGKKALAYLIRHEWRTLPRWNKIIQQLEMPEPVPRDPRGTIESILKDKEFLEKDHIFQKQFTNLEEFQKIYDEKMSSSLIASSMIGNLYTASLYLGFRSTIEFEFQKNIDLENKRFGFGSYGSGSSAMVFSGVIQPEYKDVVKNMNLESEIGERTRLSLEQYVKIHENELSPDESINNPEKEFILVNVKTDPSDRGERRYAYSE